MDGKIPERFLDAVEEPEQTLTPLMGYEKCRLVSLQEAVEPIKALLFDIDTMVTIARRNSRKPADELTQDESAAIHLYTMQWPRPHPSLYKLLNEGLRSKTREVLLPWFMFLKLLFTAFYKLPSIKGCIYRGVRGNLCDQYDEDHFWWGISSCTATMNVMETFIGISDVRTIFNIECSHGKSIYKHSYFKEENEIILMPGSYFKVVSKWKAAEKLFIIHLREVEAPFLTLTSPFDNDAPLIRKPAASADNKEAVDSCSSSATSNGEQYSFFDTCIVKFSHVHISREYCKQIMQRLSFVNILIRVRSGLQPGLCDTYLEQSSIV